MKWITSITDECRILSPTGILGYGFPEESFYAGMDKKPDLLAVDAGSVDPGPFYLGSGKPFTDRIAVKRDLIYLMKAAIKNNIPLIVGTAGGSGAKPHLDWCKKIVEEIADEEHLSFKMALITADINKKTVIEAINTKKITPLEGLNPLNLKIVEESKNIVAQMGVEPIIKALKEDCQIIIAGRAYDPSVFAAFPIALGFSPGLALHLGKILECAAIAADPGSGSDCVIGTLKKDSFFLEAMNPIRTFTTKSTAAHTLYEKSNPYLLPGPGGVIDLSKVSFNEIKPGIIEVKGSSFIKDKIYRIKLEAARSVGFRTISIAGVRDPIMISKLDSILEAVRKQVDKNLEQNKQNFKLKFHIYGKNAVMEAYEPETQKIIPREVCILIEVVADTQKSADTVCSLIRSSLLHFGYDGRIATAGNLAFPFSPSDISSGEVFEFSMYHLMEVNSPNEFFEIETIQI